MRLTVLGASGSVPGPDSACSGYLLEQDGHRVLLDCGSGVVSRLQRYCRIEELDGIILSHLHADHMADMLVLRYALAIQRSLGRTLAPMPLYMPSTPEDVARMLDYEGVFAIRYLTDGMSTRLAGLDISFARMEHSLEAYATTARARGKKLVYSGDTLYNPRLVEAAQGANLLLCEATTPGNGYAQGLPHMTAHQAAQVAAGGGARRLLLTHLWYEIPREEYEAEARRVFAGAETAEELATYEV